MRLLEYIEKDVSSARQLITSYCKPFIREMGRHIVDVSPGANYNFLWRGHEAFITNIIVMKTRNDRNPKDTPVEISKIIDDLMEEKFGWRPRSSGVFAVPNINTANEYGRPYIFFPIGQYKYIWSPQIDDMYELIAEISDFSIKDNELERDWKELGKNKSMSFEEYKERAHSKVIEKIRKYIKTYKNTGLKDAGMYNEITFNCNRYVLIDPEMQEEVIEIVKSLV
mgnify:CR=1 FL=1